MQLKLSIASKSPWQVPGGILHRLFWPANECRGLHLY